jgi:hypothetical protein
MKNNKKNGWMKSGMGAVAAISAIMATQAIAGPPVSMTVQMNGGCPTAVDDTSNSCPAGEGGRDKACVVKGGGATTLHWTSSNGEPITIVFSGSAPDGVSQSNGGNSGNVNATVSPNASEGTYKYDVKGSSCTLDPVIIVKN